MVDAASILGGTSDLTAGSITTTGTIVPNTYTVYTFASRDSPLPVTLVSFRLTREGNVSRLIWLTTEESNSDRFDIERSADGNSWQIIGTVKSKGESDAPIEYRFVDADPLYGENLYRLRLVDNDGTFAYSRVKSVRFEYMESRVAYPNPVNDIVFIKDFAKVMNVRILDMNGRAVVQSPGLKDGAINVSKLVAGVHVIEIIWSDGSKTAQRVLIRK